MQICKKIQKKNKVKQYKIKSKISPRNTSGEADCGCKNTKYKYANLQQQKKVQEKKKTIQNQKYKLAKGCYKLF